MGKEDGGLAKHSTQCSQGIDWKNSKIVTTERIWKQKKVRKGIESEKLKLKGKFLSIIMITQKTGKQ